MADRKMPMNPWRKGKAAGLDYYAAFDAYRAALRSDQPLPRPEIPVNPYPVPPVGKGFSRNAGRNKWAEGFKDARQFYEARKRCGGKEPSWGK